jgi:23S rRNA (adenine2503-C2)-methyltransferase
MTDQTPIRILDLSHEQLRELLVTWGEKPYRADQILKWIYKKSAAYEEMSDLPQSLREKLISQTVLFTFTPLEEKVASDGQTRKMLFQLDDGKTIESTLMMYRNTGSQRERRTVCVSTQVGCPIGCYFCATGQQGFERNLRPGEIIEQILYFVRFIKQNNIPAEDPELTRKAITNVVLMGMGEPLANYDNVRQAVTLLNSKYGLELGARQITLSTAGLVPQIERLAEEPLHLELAISLHAATDNLRNRLMPINKKYPLAQLIPACREYFARTGRRPTFEYALFEGVNDSAENARELAELLTGLNCSVNIIIGNPTSCQEFRSSTLEQAKEFQRRLFALGIFNTIRVSRGRDIEAGCGQLRSRWLEKR